MQQKDDDPTLDEYRAEFREDYCSDCGCIADDEVCPRCRAESVDVHLRVRGEYYRGDRRWNGQIMSRRRDIDAIILEDARGDQG